VADTLVRLAEELRSSWAPTGYGVLREPVLGRTTQAVLRRAPCPVVVVRGPQD
jgi:nucleotide-binding universal stress UspA family protein